MSTILEDYRYKGLPLTPAVAEYIIVAVLNGMQRKRNEIIATVVTTHEINGGQPISALKQTTIVKKALSNLKKRGSAVNPLSGVYRIASDSHTEEDALAVDDEIESLVASSNQPNLLPQLTLGEGAESVYVYFYPLYRTEAKNRGDDRWLCKVGRTDSSTPYRVFSQTTGMPEVPVIGLEYFTSNSRVLENVIQGVLALRGGRSDSSPGTEWYRTSVDEILSIIHFVLLDEAAKEALKNAK